MMFYRPFLTSPIHFFKIVFCTTGNLLSDSNISLKKAVNNIRLDVYTVPPNLHYENKRELKVLVLPSHER